MATLSRQTAEGIQAGFDAIGANEWERQHLPGLMYVESAFNPSADASTSTARGLGQFLNATWNETVNSVAETRPDLAQYMRQHGRDDPMASTIATVEYTRQNRALIDGPNADDPAALYASHFMGPAGGARVMEADDGASMRSVMTGNQAQANQNIAAMTVGEFKQHFRDKIAKGSQLASEVIDFASSNPMFNPGDSLEHVLADLEKNGKGKEAEAIRGQLGNESTHREGLEALRNLNTDILIEKGVSPDPEHVDASALHLASKFGGFTAASIAKAPGTATLSSLNVDQAALTTYLNESRTQFTGRLSDSPEDQRITEIINRDPAQAGNLTAEELNAVADRRGAVYNEDVKKARDASLAHSSASGQQATRNAYNNMLIGEDGQINTAALIMAVIGMLFGEQIGGLMEMFQGMMGGQAQGQTQSPAQDQTSTPAAAPVQAAAPETPEAASSHGPLPAGPTIEAASALPVGPYASVSAEPEVAAKNTATNNFQRMLQDVPLFGGGDKPGGMLDIASFDLQPNQTPINPAATARNSSMTL